jgi:ABC-type Co2+ transport system permease subunit
MTRSGWGVYLRNIALSSLVMVLLFAAVYQLLNQQLTLPQSVLLSFQSFISSFLGDWSVYNLSATMTTLITLESYLGVLFITVFVGAYIRKLLR